MKKSFIVTSILMACIFIIVGCDNLSPGTSTISGISFERDQYTLPSVANPVSSSAASKSIASSNIAISIEMDEIEALLESVFPNGELTILANGLGFTYTPTSGDNWEITDDQWDEFEDKIDDVIVTISGQEYEAEFERHDRTGDIEVELDPKIKYPASFTAIKVIDDITGKEVTGEILKAFQASGIEEYFTALYEGKTWVNDSLSIDEEIFQTEEEFETYEENFEDQFDEFIYSGTEYEFGLEEPFKNTLLIEVELEDDDDDDD